MSYRLSMGFRTGAVSDVMHRVVYPPFVSIWNALRDLTGRQRRREKTAAGKVKTAEKRRHMDLWKASHDD